LLHRNGHDWTPRYPLIVEAVNGGVMLMDDESMIGSGLAPEERPMKREAGDGGDDKRGVSPG
jgi:hypothetical protein